MKGVHDSLLTALLIAASLAFLGVAEAQLLNHLVGEDRGWDSSSDIASWSSNKLFKVGDNIWFAYSAAQEFISELSTREEFESCNVSNPIKMYTDGLNKITLEKEGPRYFVSGRPENCKNGLKLHVEVLPQSATESKNSTINDHRDGIIGTAEGPTPSSSTGLEGVIGLISIGLALAYQFAL